MSGACSTVGVFSGINNLHISIFMSGAWDFDDAHPGTGRCMRVETFEHLDRGSIAVECNSYHDDDGIVILSVSTLVNPLAVAIPSMGSMGHGQLDLLLSLVRNLPLQISYLSCYLDTWIAPFVYVFFLSLLGSINCCLFDSDIMFCSPIATLRMSEQFPFECLVRLILHIGRLVSADVWSLTHSRDYPIAKSLFRHYLEASFYARKVADHSRFEGQIRAHQTDST